MTVCVPSSSGGNGNGAKAGGGYIFEKVRVGKLRIFSDGSESEWQWKSGLGRQTSEALLPLISFVERETKRTTHTSSDSDLPRLPFPAPSPPPPEEALNGPPA